MMVVTTASFPEVASTLSNPRAEVIAGRSVRLQPLLAAARAWRSRRLVSAIYGPFGPLV